MGNNLAGADHDKRQYDEFEPLCKWHRKEAEDTLEVYLPAGFKKDQLHVMANKGSVSVWGEKPVDPPKWQRFRKDVKLEKQHKVCQIKSHLSVDRKLLSISIPKEPTLAQQVTDSFSRAASSFAKSVFSKFKAVDSTVGTENFLLLLNLLLLLVSFAIFFLCYLCNNKNKC